MSPQRIRFAGAAEAGGIVLFSFIRVIFTTGIAFIGLAAEVTVAIVIPLSGARAVHILHTKDTYEKAKIQAKNARKCKKNAGGREKPLAITSRFHPSL